MATVSRQHVVTNLEDFYRVARSYRHKVEVITGPAKQMKIEDIFAHSTPFAGIKKNE